MESYDEFARRAKIMTEIHATIKVDSDCKISGDCTVSSSSSSINQSANKKKEKDAMKKSLKRL